jgi:hypothetical protein
LLARRSFEADDRRVIDDGVDLEPLRLRHEHLAEARRHEEGRVARDRPARHGSAAPVVGEGDLVGDRR